MPLDCPHGTHQVVEASVHGPATYAYCARRGVKEGPARITSVEGAVLMEGAYRGGREQGDFVHTNEAGVVWATAHYEAGRLDGVQRFYDPSTGVLAWETGWRDGLKQGAYRRYFPDGTVERVEWYDRDLPVGEHEEFYLGGVRRSVMPYANGVANGVAYYWNPDGTMIVKETWTDGVRHGAYQRWHAMDQLEADGAYVDGVARGPWTWWLSDGTLWHRADPFPCAQAEERLGIELYDELGAGAVYLRIEPGTWKVTGWASAWRPYPHTTPDPPYATPAVWRDPAEIDLACLPSPTPMRWDAPGLDAATIAAIDRAVSMTAVPGGIAWGGYFGTPTIVRDGDDWIAIVRGMWLE